MKYLMLASAMFLGTSLPLALAAPSTASVRRGEYMFRVTGCANCHTQNPAEPLAGGAGITIDNTTFYPPNITMDPEAGIGRWTDADFIRALRKGISPEGLSYFPVFPYASYTQLSDEDMLAIKAYIGTLPKSSRKNPFHELPFYLRRTLLLDANPLLFAWRANDSMMRSRDGDLNPSNFMTAEGPFQPFPSLDASWNRGAYLVEGALHCTQCHTPRSSVSYLLTSRWMGGGLLSGVSIPNLTPAASSFVASWSDTDWDKFLATGQNPWGHEVSGEMAAVIRTQTSALSPADRAAVIRYFRALPPVDSD